MTDSAVYTDLNVHALDADVTMKLPVFNALPPTGVVGQMVFIKNPLVNNVDPNGFVWVFTGINWKQLSYLV